MIYLNVISLILFPNGLYNSSDSLDTRHYYFIGHQNQMNLYSLVVITLGEIRSYMQTSKAYNKKRLLAIKLLSLFFVFRVWSANSIVGVVLIIILTTYLKKINRKIPSVLFSYMLNMGIFLSIAVLQKFNLFGDLIWTILHREATFSGRTQIWSNAINAFLLEPIWGYGLQMGRELINFRTAHNRYMNNLFTGGIINMFLFTLMLIVINKAIENCTDKMIRNLFACFFCVLLLVLQMETFDGYMFYIMIVMTYNINLITSKSIKRDKEIYSRYAENRTIIKFLCELYVVIQYPTNAL